MVHNHCHHNFGFCAQCDLVYCKNCKKEWGNQHQHWGSWPYNQGTYTIPSITTSGTFTVADGSNVTSSVGALDSPGHSHN